MILGTSNSYTNGVTNDGLCIDQQRLIGIGTDRFPENKLSKRN